MAPPRATRTIENAMRRWGFVLAAGVDEVGRGCLAGPVVAAAVMLDPARPIAGLRDSKLLTRAARERLDVRIRTRARAWAIAGTSPAEIDRLNIHRASLDAMRRAILALAPLPDLVLVDAFSVPDLPMAQRGIIRGDTSCAAIAAASIIAKVWRDRLMCDLHEADGRYGYAQHKGYATAGHLVAIAQHGLSVHHRRSFRQPTLFDALTEAS
jgi:ribonuclease HII